MLTYAMNTHYTHTFTMHVHIILQYIQHIYTHTQK